MSASQLSLALLFRANIALFTLLAASPFANANTINFTGLADGTAVTN
jgi:hypothetical protein